MYCRPEQNINEWFYQSIKRKYTIEYTGLNTEFVYAPYITDTDSLPDDVTIDNDYIIKKDRSLKELSLTATDYKMFSGGIGSSGFEFVPDYQIEQHSGLYDEYDVGTIKYPDSGKNRRYDKKCGKL